MNEKSTSPAGTGQKKKNVLSRNILGKGKYPSKKSINLYKTQSHAGRNLASLGIFAVFIVCLMVFVKFMVLDKLDQIGQQKLSYDSQSASLRQMAALNKDYDEVADAYAHYGEADLSADEQELQDRLDMLAVIEKELIDQNLAVNMTISGNTASLTINSDKLRNVSEIVAKLESYENVEYVTVTRSVTGDSTRSRTSSASRQTGNASAAGDTGTQTGNAPETTGSGNDIAAAADNDAENDSAAAAATSESADNHGSSSSALQDGGSEKENETEIPTETASGTRRKTVYSTRVISEGIPNVDPGVNVGDTPDSEGVVVPGRTVSYYEGEMAGSGRETEIVTEYVTETVTEGTGPENSLGMAAEKTSQENIPETEEKAGSAPETAAAAETATTTETAVAADAATTAGTVTQPETETAAAQTPQQMVVTTLTIYFKSRSQIESESEGGAQTGAHGAAAETETETDTLVLAQNAAKSEEMTTEDETKNDSQEASVEAAAEPVSGTGPTIGEIASESGGTAAENREAAPESGGAVAQNRETTAESGVTR